VTIALVSNIGAASSDGNTFTSGAIDTSGADFLVMEIAEFYFFAESTISDSYGNTWTILPTYQTGTGPRMRIAFVENPTVGSGHTFTCTGTGIYASFAVAAFSGVSTTSPQDQETGNNGGTVTSIQPGSITPPENNELIITGVGVGGLETLAIDSSFTITDDIPYALGMNYGSGLAYKIQTTAGAENPTWSWSASIDAVSAIASFKSPAVSTFIPKATWFL